MDEDAIPLASLSLTHVSYVRLPPRGAQCLENII